MIRKRESKSIKPQSQPTVAQTPSWTADEEQSAKKYYNLYDHDIIFTYLIKIQRTRRCVSLSGWDVAQTLCSGGIFFSVSIDT
jgi:hypothetical protein